MSNPTGIDALRLALVVLKTQTAMAAVVSRTSQAVSDLLKRGDRVPAEWCLPLEAATAAAGQKISRSQFRPDLWPEEFAALPKPSPVPGQREPGERNHARAPGLGRGLRALIGGG